ncbi:MAG: hypothetical protein AAGC57_03175 [Pseudomonadota bacterium]
MMPSIDSRFRQTGTKFRLYPQSPVLEGFRDPQTVWVSSPVGSLGPGPSDHRMVTRDPIGKKPYGEDRLPPWTGRSRPPLLPGRDGHFDHIDPNEPEFLAAHMFGTVRRVMDVWEAYLGGPIAWAFASTHPRLELIPHVPWNNAHFGWGFMEAGEGKDDQGVERPFALNFDVLAHETGHGLVFAIVGMPGPGAMSTAYRGFHESASDITAMIAALHFDSFLDHVLKETEGDLYVANAANRIGELSKTRQIRSAANALTMADVIPLDTPVEEVTGKQVHKLGQPLTGAMFDILVEFFEERLEALSLIPSDHAALSRSAVQAKRAGEVDPTPVTDAYGRNPRAFRRALAEARDMLGLRIAQTWHRLSPRGLSYSEVGKTLLAVDRSISGQRNQSLIRAAFTHREIDV